MAMADEPVDYAIWRPGAPDGVGDLHRGRLLARMPALAGSFLRLADREGFLPDSDGDPSATEGSAIGVRIVRAAQGGKGPRLTARLAETERALVGSGPPALLRRGPSPVERLAAVHPEAPVLADDAALVARLRAALGDRLRLVERAFDDEAEAVAAALAEPFRELGSGLTMTVYPTPALTAIDIDLAAGSAERGTKTRVHERANREALPQIAREIRLRNLGGAIFLDFAGLSPKRRAALQQPLSDALAADPLRPKLLGFTALGLAEIVRPRVYPPLHELLAGPHAAGLAALRALGAEISAMPHRAPLLAAAPAVVTALQADAIALADLARRAGRPLMMRPDPTLSPLGWRIED